jgi:hypothetical protein
MPNVVFTHAVKDVAHWASKHSERVNAFAPWGTNVVDHLSADGANNVAVTAEVHDLAAMKKAIISPEIEAAKKAHGVIDPISVYVEKS